MTMKIGIDVKYRATKPSWSPNFDIYFQICIILQSFLIGRLQVAMATVFEIRLHGFVRNVYSYIIYPSIMKYG